MDPTSFFPRSLTSISEHSALGFKASMLSYFSSPYFSTYFTVFSSSTLLSNTGAQHLRLISSLFFSVVLTRFFMSLQMSSSPWAKNVQVHFLQKFQTCTTVYILRHLPWMSVSRVTCLTLSSLHLPRPSHTHKNDTSMLENVLC